MSSETSQLADALRSRASATITSEHEQHGDQKGLDLAWRLFKRLIEMKKEQEEELEELRNQDRLS